MKGSLLQFSIPPLILLLCLTFGCKQQGVGVDVEADIAAIEDLVNQYGAAVNAGDLDLWISLWTDNGIQMPPNAPAVIGKEQIRAANESMFAEFILEMVVTNKEVRVASDLAFARGTYTLSLIPNAGGETSTIDGKYLSIVERQADGSWKFARDCFNDNTPPEQAGRAGTAG
jgi:uncharacterized protein (TIGR02246 family)